MDFSSIFFIAISVICLLLLTNSLLSSNNSRKKYPPSPPSLPIIGHLHLLKKPLHHTLSHLSNCYGPILLLRFGCRRVLVISSFSMAEECFTKNDIIFANRPQFPSIKHLSYNFTTMGSTNYGPHWRNLRRIATVEVLSSQRLNSFEHIRAEEVRSMVRRLFKESSSREKTKVELKSRLFELTLNNMMRMVVGKRYYNENSVDTEEARRFWKCVEEVLELSGASNLGDFLPLLGWMDVQGVRKKMKRLAKYRDGFLQTMIDERRKKGQMGESCMVGDLLEMQDKDPDYYTDQTIKGLIIALLVAGTDTTSQTIEWVISLLLNHPGKLKKVQYEIHNHCHNRLLQESDLSDLPYLQCIILETLRLYPAGPLLVPHESSEACTVGGYNITPGTILLVNAYSINRNSRTWKNPERFEPERHWDANGVRMMMTFGMGRRRCPGEALANKLVGLVVGTMIQCFDWERVGDELVDMSEGSSITLPRAAPLYAMYQPRKGMTGILMDI